MRDSGESAPHEFTFQAPALPAQNPLLKGATVTSATGSSPAKTERLDAMISRRKRVPFEIGHSPLDWARICKAKNDLSGLKGERHRKDITLEEVATHNRVDDAWTVINRKVYNLTPYMKYHPGGAKILHGVMGKDGTAQFNRYHPWVNIEFLLGPCLVGSLLQG